MSFLRAKLRSFTSRTGAPLDPALNQRFELELAETTRRRLLVLFPIVLVGHSVHIWVFHTSAAQRAVLDPNILRWRDGIARAHLATLVPVVLIGATCCSHASGRRNAGSAA